MVFCLALTNIGSFTQISFQFPDVGSVLITGPSESGKTTILRALKFVLTGEEQQRLVSVDKKSASVTLKTDEFTITRSLGPKKLVITFPDQQPPLEEAAGESFLKQHPEQCLISYHPQRFSALTWLTMGPTARMKEFEKWAFEDWSLDWKPRLSDEMKMLEKGCFQKRGQLSGLQSVKPTPIQFPPYEFEQIKSWLDEVNQHQWKNQELELCEQNLSTLGDRRVWKNFQFVRLQHQKSELQQTRNQSLEESDWMEILRWDKLETNWTPEDERLFREKTQLACECPHCETSLIWLVADHRLELGKLEKQSSTNEHVAKQWIQRKQQIDCDRQEKERLEKKYPQIEFVELKQQFRQWKENQNELKKISQELSKFVKEELIELPDQSQLTLKELTDRIREIDHWEDRKRRVYSQSVVQTSCPVTAKELHRWQEQWHRADAYQQWKNQIDPLEKSLAEVEQRMKTTSELRSLMISVEQQILTERLRSFEQQLNAICSEFFTHTIQIQVRTHRPR